MKIELDFSNYAAKIDLKMQQVLIRQNLLKVDLGNLKPNVDKLDNDKLKNALTNVSNLKSKVGKLEVDKLVPVPVDLSKLSDLVKHDATKKDVYNAKIKLKMTYPSLLS